MESRWGSLVRTGAERVRRWVREHPLQCESARAVPSVLEAGGVRSVAYVQLGLDRSGAGLSNAHCRCPEDGPRRRRPASSGKSWLKYALRSPPGDSRTEVTDGHGDVSDGPDPGSPVPRRVAECLALGGGTRGVRGLRLPEDAAGRDPHARGP